MTTINLDRGSRVRKDPDGTLWIHVRCDQCQKNGAGSDPSAHMGIGIRRNGRVTSKCWRCGSKLPPTTRFTLNGEEFGAGGSRVYRPIKKVEEPQALSRDRVPGLALSSLGPEWAYTAQVRRVVEAKWPGITWDQQVAAGLRVIEGGWATFYCPLWTTNGWGYIERRLGGEGPKALNRGPRGVGFLREIEPNEERAWVWVEGWFDAVAVPPPFEPVILRGTSNFPKTRGDIYLALDADSVGQAAVRKAVVRFLKDGRNVRVVDFGGEKDPGDIGTAGMVAALKRARRIKGIGDLVAWLNSSSK